MKFLPEMYSWTKKNRLNFRSHAHLEEPDLIWKFFEAFFSIARRGISPRFRLFPLENRSDLRENFGIHPDPESGTGIQTGFTLAEVYALTF